MLSRLSRCLDARERYRIFDTWSSTTIVGHGGLLLLWTKATEGKTERTDKDTEEESGDRKAPRDRESRGGRIIFSRLPLLPSVCSFTQTQCHIRQNSCPPPSSSSSSRYSYDSIGLSLAAPECVAEEWERMKWRGEFRTKRAT
ncbi:hypothetical protein MTO96_011036 [Rhipicephalus appendiculatus]